MSTQEHLFHPHLQNLNQPQLEAVQHFQGPILILAGAGSGKTRVLTRRVAHLIVHHNIAPHKVLAVTFTNKATAEMKKRIDELVGRRSSRPWVSTFHSAALRILRRHASLIGFTSDFVVYDDQDSKSLVKRLLKELGVDEKQYPIAMFRRAIDQAKNSNLSPEAYEQRFGMSSAKSRSRSGDHQHSMISEVYDAYQKKLLESNAMDFGDLLVNVVRIFTEHQDVLQSYRDHFDFILVDEFQDTNKVQYQFIRLISEPKRNLFVVGDDDQSIYGFRGADVWNILDFEKDYPKTRVIKLEQNYRSTRNILEAAHAVISKNPERRDKKLWTDAPDGDKVDLYCGDDEADEASFVAAKIHSYSRAGISPRDIAVFYRTNAQSRALEEALMQRGVPYRIYGGLKFYDRKEIKDIVAYLKLIANPSDSQSFLRVVNTPPRGIGAQSLAQIVETASRNSVPLLEAARDVGASSRNVAKFVAMMDLFFSESMQVPLHQLISTIVEKSEYGPKLRAMKDVSAESRLENLKELEGLAATFAPGGDEPPQVLRQFLDRVALSSGDELPIEESKDIREKNSPDAVSLMTLHLAKGLEFPYVFFTGIEEGLVPHHRSLEEGTVPEERRLCYVGMTRAIKKLHLSRSRNRAMFAMGGTGSFGSRRKVSRFALDIPVECFEENSEREMFFSEEAISTMEYDFEPDDSSGWSINDQQKRAVNNFRKKKAAANPSLASMVTSADTLPTQDLTEGLPRLDVTDIEPGLHVVHPSFGKGVIEEIEGEPSSSSKLKLKVWFEDSDTSRKLIFQYANLAKV